MAGRCPDSMPLGSGWTDGVSIASPSARKGDRPMDFEVTYSEEQQRFRAEVRAWLTEHVAPDITRTPTSREDNYHRYQQLRALGRELGAKGWLFPPAPLTYGGADSTSITPSSSRRRSTASTSPCRRTTTAAAVSERRPSWCGGRRSRSAPSCPRSIRAPCAPGSSSPSPAPAPTSPGCA